MTGSSHDVTRLLLNWSDGDQHALEELMQVVYDQLRQQAARYFRRERQGHTLQTTALVHEVYLRLVDQKRVRWQNRAHFFAIAAQLMRRILVDHARSHRAAKHGGTYIKVSFNEAIMKADEQDVDFVALDEALTRLTALDPRQAHVVELRFFSGLSIEETAEVLGVSRGTVKNDWSLAKAWLRRELRRERAAPEEGGPPPRAVQR